MIIVGLIILGLALGSFVNALVWRLHEQEKPRKRRVASDSELSIVSGRSMCPRCQHTLAWYDLLPVISWLSLGGKCRYCHQPISWQYPLVELATAFLFVISYAFWPYSIHTPYSVVLFGLWLIFVTGFMALMVYDLRWMILPNRLVFPLQVLAVLYVAIQVVFGLGGWQLAQGALLGVVCSAGLFYVLFQLSQGRWIGGGDVKLAVVLGLLLTGPLRALAMLFVASLLGSIVGIPLLLKGKAKRNTRLPFGPFLIVATIIVYLFGVGLIAWYKRQFLFI